MAHTPDTQPVRKIEELRTTSYNDMNSAEILKFQREDPDAYRDMVAALDGPPAPVEGEPLPMSKARQIYRNGVEVDTNLAVRYVNGVIQQ